MFVASFPGNRDGSGVEKRVLILDTYIFYKLCLSGALFPSNGDDLAPEFRSSLWVSCKPCTHLTYSRPYSRHLQHSLALKNVMVLHMGRLSCLLRPLSLLGPRLRRRKLTPRQRAMGISYISVSSGIMAGDDYGPFILFRMVHTSNIETQSCFD